MHLHFEFQISTGGSFVCSFIRLFIYCQALGAGNQPDIQIWPDFLYERLTLVFTYMFYVVVIPVYDEIQQFFTVPSDLVASP